ncbi:MAG: DEAD/DEAH box helicase [archaeon]
MVTKESTGKQVPKSKSPSRGKGMRFSSLKGKIPKAVYDTLSSKFSHLRPAQEKAVKAGLLEGKSLLICTPTASGKTLTAEMAFSTAILSNKQKALYIVPLKALGSEKYKDFSTKYSELFSVALSIGDLDSGEKSLADKDLIICTSEKLDSLFRHRIPWVKSIGTVIIDEIHLLNDPSRGPTLEILITMLRQLLEHVQIVGLSATIGNPRELADWLDATLVEDRWRPVPLAKGVYHDGTIEFP